MMEKRIAVQAGCSLRTDNNVGMEPNQREGTEFWEKNYLVKKSAEKEVSHSICIYVHAVSKPANKNNLNEHHTTNY